MSEDQYLAKTYGKHGGVYENVDAASRRTRSLNQQKQGYEAAVMEAMVSSSKGGYLILNSGGTWKYRYDSQVKAFVVYQK